MRIYVYDLDKLTNFVCGLKEKYKKYMCLFTKSVCKALCFVFLYFLCDNLLL